MSTSFSPLNPGRCPDSNCCRNENCCPKCREFASGLEPDECADEREPETFVQAACDISVTVPPLSSNADYNNLGCNCSTLGTTVRMVGGSGGGGAIFGPGVRVELGPSFDGSIQNLSVNRETGDIFLSYTSQAFGGSVSFEGSVDPRSCFVDVQATLRETGGNPNPDAICNAPTSVIVRFNARDACEAPLGGNTSYGFEFEGRLARLFGYQSQMDKPEYTSKLWKYPRNSFLPFSGVNKNCEAAGYLEEPRYSFRGFANYDPFDASVHCPECDEYNGTGRYSGSSFGTPGCSHIDLSCPKPMLCACNNYTVGLSSNQLNGSMDQTTRFRQDAEDVDVGKFDDRRTYRVTGVFEDVPKQSGPDNARCDDSNATLGLRIERFPQDATRATRGLILDPSDVLHNFGWSPPTVTSTNDDRLTIGGSSPYGCCAPRRCQCSQSGLWRFDLAGVDDLPCCADGSNFNVSKTFYFCPDGAYSGGWRNVWSPDELNVCKSAVGVAVDPTDDTGFGQGFWPRFRQFTDDNGNWRCAVGLFVAFGTLAQGVGGAPGIDPTDDISYAWFPYFPGCDPSNSNCTSVNLWGVGYYGEIEGAAQITSNGVFCNCASLNGSVTLQRTDDPLEPRGCLGSSGVHRYPATLAATIQHQ